MERSSIAITAQIPAVLQLGLAAVLAVTGAMALGEDYVYQGVDVSGPAHVMGALFCVAAALLALVGGANLAGRVVVDADGITVRTVRGRRRAAWPELVGIDFGRVPFVGDAIVFRTERGDAFGSGILRVRRRGNVFELAEALDRFGEDGLAGERLRRYIDSNGLYA